jgi:hypothetical protein
MVNSYKRNYAGFCISQVCCSQGPCPFSRPLWTHTSPGDSWTLTGKCGLISRGNTVLSSGFWSAKVFFMSSKCLFHQYCGNSVIKSYWPPKSKFSVFLSNPQIGKSVVDPRTFLTVWEFLWYNCSAVCGSSAQQLYGGANGDLLQEDLCHMLHDPSLLQPARVPVPAADSCWPVPPQEILKHSKIDMAQSLWRSLSPSAHRVLFEPKITADSDFSHEIKRCLLLLEEKLWPT